MASQNKNFISLVALGGQNPQILNLDFLTKEKIIPVDKAPFDALLKQEKPLKKFVSVPGLTNLIIGDIEFVVDEQRFQIRDRVISEWTETTILNIASKYFKVLHYTPLKIVGINLNSTIAFSSEEEARSCQELCLPRDSRLVSIVSNDNISASLALRYPYDEGGRITLTIEQPNKEKDKRVVNLNYEFDLATQDWSKLNDELSKFPDIAKYADSIFDRLLGAL